MRAAMTSYIPNVQPPTQEELDAMLASDLRELAGHFVGPKRDELLARADALTDRGEVC